MTDHIYYNGEIHTFDTEDHVYEAVATEDGRVIATGSNKEVFEFQSAKTEMINLHHQTVLPGFIDAHLHIFPLGFNLSYVDCQLHSIEEVVKAIKERANKASSDEEWIIGAGFDESLFKEGRKLNKWDFKDVKNPVYITRYCLHEAVANKAAIEKANITDDTQVDNGIIERDDAGEATGLLKENAMSLIEDALPPHTTESMKEAVQFANDYLLKNGITSAHDAGLGFFVDPYKEFNVLRQMSQEGKLNIKMYLMILAEHFKAFMEENKNAESAALKFGSMKLFSDGTLSGKTAAQLLPYKDSEEKGLLNYSDDEMKMYVQLAHEMGEQVAIHAIGSRAVDQVLRVYEIVNQEYPREDFRHRIEHATITNDDLIQRMDQLQVVPVPQPSLIYAAGDVHNSVINGDAVKYFAFQSFMDKNLQPAGSSDGPVVDSSPLLGIYSAMERKTVRGQVFNEDERLSLKDAIKMYTLHAAHAAFEENMKGSIEKNKYADFVVLPERFMKYSAEQVKTAKIEKTIINGEVVYSK